MWLELAERLLGVNKLRALERAARSSGQPTIFHGLLAEGGRTLDVTGSMADALPARQSTNIRTLEISSVQANDWSVK